MSIENCSDIIIVKFHSYHSSTYGNGCSCIYVWLSDKNGLTKAATSFRCTFKIIKEKDGSTAHRYLKSPRSLSGWSFHLALVMVIIDQQCQSMSPFLTYSYWKFDLENPRSRSWPRWDLMATFEAQCSIDTLIFRFVAIVSFLAEIHQIPYFMVMANLNPYCHMPRIQSICLLLVSFSLDNYWLRYSK